ncbi:phosphotransferase [Nocardiopsis protaetiae]|uniref:phosphotransferase n=1 Tax=Nocardiopsis protaetiae TaxID=3382270 RepID=UPI00387B4A80
MSDTFTKAYTSPDRAGMAVSHHAWLRSMGAPVPALLDASPEELVFAHVEGEHCGLADFPAVAALLGHLHATAFAHQLRAARLDAPFSAPNGVRLAEFVNPRLDLLEGRRREGILSGPQYEAAATLITGASQRPAAFYKDSNIRNVLIGVTSPVLVDFDDLTLAPFGYDLAKLLVSAAMTYGPLDGSLCRRTLDSYRHAVEAAGGPVDCCSWEELGNWTEIHDLLTSGYLGRNGYKHRWTGLPS